MNHIILSEQINNENMKKKTAKKIIAFSIIPLFVIASVTIVAVFSINKSNKPNGVGGLETASVPEFSQESDNTSILNDEINLEELIETAPEDKTEEETLFYQTYRVQPGDMISYIADEYNITQDTIISVNNIRQSRLIQVGQYLKIPSLPGILYTVKKDGETIEQISEKYSIDAQKCAAVNISFAGKELSAGETMFLPGAELDWVTRQEINGDLFHKPLRARYWLSSAYGWRNSPFTGQRSFHGGMDMAASQGTPIYAALDGVVVATGYNATYGNYVIISHHSGYRTLYGHMSKITCKKGNFVYTNTKIGEVGSTGLSTGPHLHFTVYKNGKTINPATLIN
jgi:murein DD-endopeptidase MepM/ murein hydrolase activator NlpD